MIKQTINPIPPLLVTGYLWNACGLTKSLSSNAPFLILKEYLLIIKKIKKLIRAKIDKKLASIDYDPI